MKPKPTWKQYSEHEFTTELDVCNSINKTNFINLFNLKMITIALFVSLAEIL